MSNKVWAILIIGIEKIYPWEYDSVVGKIGYAVYKNMAGERMKFTSKKNATAVALNASNEKLMSFFEGDQIGNYTNLFSKVVPFSDIDAELERAGRGFDSIAPTKSGNYTTYNFPGGHKCNVRKRRKKK